MAGRDLEAAIRISGELDTRLRRSIENAVSSLDGLDDAARQASDAAGALSDVIDRQSATLRAAQRQYAAYVLSGEQGSRQARELANEIRELSADLNRNRSSLRNAETAAQQLADGLDDAGDAAQDTGSGFTVMGGAAANLVASGIQTIVSSCANAVSSLYGLAEQTREFRQDMATLETAYDKAGFSAETAGDTWKDLYAIFGEDDRAVEAANNISRMSKTQQDLDNWVQITTGIWGTYQDALPVESLAEAAGETAKVGTVTGALADALNWNSDAAKMFAKYMNDDVTTAEDAFNVRLSKCTTEAERQAVITDTLTKLYGSAAEKYEETAGSIMEANRATADYTVAAANLGERIEPVTTAIQAGFAGLLANFVEFVSGADVAGFTGKITSAFQRVETTLSPVAQNLLPVLGQAFQDIRVRVSPLITMFSTIAKSLIPLFSAAVSGLWPVITTLMDAIAPVIAALRIVVTNLVPPLIGLIRMIAPILQTVAAIIRDEIRNAIQIVLPIINNFINIFSGLISFFQNVFLGNWAGVWASVKSIFANAFQALVGIARAPLNAIFSMINSVISGINSIGFDIPDWVPGVGGQSFHIDIPQLPMLAKGGFTNGLSIAGEAGTEAVISFDPRYRSQNLSYWAKAGQMLGASDVSLSGGWSGGDVNFGGVTFAPQITITGMADKQTVMQAIEDEYPEFIDLLESWWAGRGKPVYG